MAQARTKAWFVFFCGRDRRGRNAQFRHVNNEWQLVSVASQAMAAGATPGELQLTGQFTTSPEYRGCPSCGNDGYFKCGSCGALSCWRSNTTTALCGNCGRSGPVSGRIESMSASDVS